MLRIVGTMKPITDSRRPPPAPTVPANTRVVLGKGGSGTSAWEARIEPLDSSAGFSVHFPFQEQHEPGKGWPLRRRPAFGSSWRADHRW